MAHRKNLTPEIEAAVRRDLADGVPLRVTAFTLGVGRDLVAAWRTTLGINAPRANLKGSRRYDIMKSERLPKVATLLLTARGRGTGADSPGVAFVS